MLFDRSETKPFSRNLNTKTGDALRGGPEVISSASSTSKLGCGVPVATYLRISTNEINQRYSLSAQETQLTG
jgi:hypothetical protein